MLSQVAGQIASEVARQLKSIATLVQGYVDDLTRDVQDVLDGSLAWSEAKRRHRTYIRDNAEPAYLEGLAEGGAEDAELTDTDRATIKVWIDTQLGYVAGLWADVSALFTDYYGGKISRTEYVDRRRALYERIGVWGDALRDLANQGKAAALADVMCTWEYGDTVEHCRTCEKLSGKRHRLSWFTSRGYIPREVGSETLECGGWRCQCRLVADDGKQVLP